jgi:hypothetical protein
LVRIHANHTTRIIAILGIAFSVYSVDCVSTLALFEDLTNMNRHTRASKCIALSRILSTTNLHANSDSESDTDEITSETESLIDEVGNTDSESDNEYSGDHPFEEIGHVNESSSDQLTSPGGEIWTEVTAQRITQTGRLGASNVIRMLPGLTRYAHQRIRDQPLLDCFHIIFSFGEFH